MHKPILLIGLLSMALLSGATPCCADSQTATSAQKASADPKAFDRVEYADRDQDRDKNPEVKEAINDMDRTKAELIAWAKPVQGELSSSGNDVDRAMGYGMQLLLGTIEAEAKGALGDADLQAMNEVQLGQAERIRQELLSGKTSVPAKMIYLTILCNASTLPTAATTCAELVALEPFKKIDANNVYLILFKHHLSSKQQQLAQIQEIEKARKQLGADQAKTESGRKAIAKLVEAQRVEAEKALLRELSVGTRYDDYGLVYKERIRRILKNRPLPDSMLARLGPQYMMVAKFFPLEDIVAWVGGNALVAGLNEASSRLNVLKGDSKQATKKRIFELLLANPKTSAASVSMFEPPKDHAFLKPFEQYKNLDEKKHFSPDLLLTANWLGLRPVLAKAITQGDLAALPDTIRWADAELAKVPDKSNEEIATEKAKRDAQLAKYTAQREAYTKADAAIKKGCTEEADRLKKAGTVTEEKKLSEIQNKCNRESKRDAMKKIYEETDAEAAADAAAAAHVATEAAAEASSAVIEAQPAAGVTEVRKTAKPSEAPKQ